MDFYYLADLLDNHIDFNVDFYPCTNEENLVYLRLDLHDGVTYFSNLFNYRLLIDNFYPNDDKVVCIGLIDENDDFESMDFDTIKYLTTSYKLKTHVNGKDLDVVFYDHRGSDGLFSK